MRFLIWILRFFWPPAAAALQAYLDKQNQEAEAAVTQVQQQMQEVDSEIEEEKQHVDTMSGSALDDELDKLHDNAEAHSRSSGSPSTGDQ